MDLTQASSLLNNFSEGFKANIPSDIAGISSLGDLTGAITKRAQDTLGQAGVNVDLSGVSDIKSLASKFNPSEMQEVAKTRALSKLNEMSPVKIPSMSSLNDLKGKLNAESLKSMAKDTASKKMEEASGTTENVEA